MSAAPKKQYASKLLIGDDPAWRWQETLYRSEWVFDVYSFARAELFIRAPRITASDNTRSLGNTLRRAFSECTRNAVPLSDSSPLYGTGPGEKPVVMVGCGRWKCMVMNAAAYDGWTATGLTPFVTDSGVVIWRGERNGRDTIWGAFMAMRISSGYKFPATAPGKSGEVSA